MIVSKSQVEKACDFLVTSGNVAWKQYTGSGLTEMPEYIQQFNLYHSGLNCDSKYMERIF